MLAQSIKRVVILCGGRGTRLQRQSSPIPKPLVEIGGYPILWHVINLFVGHGLNNFVLCTGYKKELIERFVSEHDLPTGINIDCVDTGVDTPTGARIKKAKNDIGTERFIVTYSDGLADICLANLMECHSESGKLATMTVVQPTDQFGVALLNENDQVTQFQEKPRSNNWVNGGFFCFEPEIFDHITDNCVLERDVLAKLAKQKQLQAYRHTGFWECMDTYKDTLNLNDLWNQGDPPWKIWK